jgi:hypothetical protein
VSDGRVTGSREASLGICRFFMVDICDSLSACG